MSICHLTCILGYCCSVAKSCQTLCDPMECSMPGFPVLHYLPEFAQTHVHWVSDAIQLSRPLSSPFRLLVPPKDVICHLTASWGQPRSWVLMHWPWDGIMLVIPHLSIPRTAQIHMWGGVSEADISFGSQSLLLEMVSSPGSPTLKLPVCPHLLLFIP